MTIKYLKKASKSASTDDSKTSDIVQNLLKELENSKELFRKNNWPTIDVTRKSVEETAAAIIKMLDILSSR